MEQPQPITPMGADLIRQVVDWACETFAPQLVIYAGSSVLDGLRYFEERGITSFGLVPGETPQAGKWFTPEGTVVEQPANQPWDLVVIHQEALGSFRDGWFGGQGNRLGTVKRILLILDAASAPPVLPTASRWLAGSGFVREIPKECWVNDRYLLCSYRPSSVDAAGLIEAYEARIWELSQLDQKRRGLLGEYQAELIQSAFQMEDLAKVKLAKLEEKFRPAVDNSNRWEAFQLSRTGKLLNFLQGLRGRLIPGKK